MPWTAGTFTRTDGTRTGATTWQQADAAAVDIVAPDHDAHDEDLAQGIDNCLTKDGQNSPSADLPMNAKKHTGVANAALRTQYAAAGQVQDNALCRATDSGAADAYALTLSPAITAYATGQRFSFVAGNTNTGASTLDVNSVGTKAIQKLGAALVAGDITAGDVVVLEYDGTQFQMVSPARTPVFAAGGVATAGLADDAVTLAKMAGGTDGNLITYDADGDPAHVATGTAGQVLTSGGEGVAPTFEDIPAPAFTAYYESAAQTITSAGALTLTHGLGAEPKGFQLVLECTTNDVGFVVGERIFAAPATGFGVQSPVKGTSVAVKFTSTQILVRYGNATALFGYVNDDDGEDALLTNANWELYVRAWA
jgi:hypothetical protein